MDIRWFVAGVCTQARVALYSASLWTTGKADHSWLLNGHGPCLLPSSTSSHIHSVSYNLPCMFVSVYLSVYLSLCLSVCSLMFDSLCCCFTCRKSQESTLGSSLSSSERDGLRQRLSVATHPFYPVLLCSDGYMVSTMSLSATFSLATLVNSLVGGARAIAGLSRSHL